MSEIIDAEVYNKRFTTVLNSCRKWSIENKCCKILYTHNHCQCFSHFVMDTDSYDKNCNGKSNASLCIAFEPDVYTAEQLYKQFNELHKDRAKILVHQKRLL